MRRPILSEVIIKASLILLGLSLTTDSNAAQVTSTRPDRYILKNVNFEREITAPKGQPLSTVRCTSPLGGTLDFTGEEFAFTTDKGELTSLDFKVDRVESRLEDDVAILKAALVAENWKAEIRFELKDDDFFDTRHLALEYTGEAPGRLDRVWNGSFRVANFTKIIKNSTHMTDLAAYVRLRKGGFFLSIDFPFSEIKIEGDRARLGYVLQDELSPGYRHVADPLNTAAYKLSGIPISSGGGLKIDTSGEGWMTASEIRESTLTSDSPDRAEVAALRHLYEIIAPPRRPECTLNYQTYDDMDPRREQASIMDRPWMLYRDMDLVSELGFNTYNIFETVNDFLPDRPPLSEYRRAVEYARKKGLITGSGAGCNFTIEFFSKAEPDTWTHPEWAYLNQNGERNGRLMQCFGVPQAVKYMASYHAPWIRDYRLTFYAFDYFFIQECHDPKHPHPPGRDSFYKQMKGAVDYHMRLREANPKDETYLYGWLGYDPWAPKMGKYVDAFYFSDPSNTWPMPAANLHEQMEDSYRRFKWQVFMRQGLPLHMQLNPIFLANWRDGLVHDAETYQKGIIQLFAFGPNINLLQLHRFMGSLTVAQHAEAVAFFKKWFAYTKENSDTLYNLEVLTPSPAPGVLEAYAHPSDAGDKCILVMINPNFFRMEKTIPINQIIGLRDTEKQWFIHEKFPTDRWCLIDGRTRWDWNEGVRLSVPPKTTMLLEIVPGTPVKRGDIRWFGFDPQAKGKKIEKYKWAFQDEQLKTYPIALEMAPVRHVAGVKARHPEPRGPFEPVDVQHREGCTFFELTFPANLIPDPVQREITDWVVKIGSLEEGIQNEWTKRIEGEPTCFPLDSILNCADHDKLMTDPGSITYEGKNIGKFMGTMMYHPWYWDMPLEVQVEIATGECPDDDSQPERFPAVEPANGPREFEAADEYWLSTNLNQMAVQNRLMGYTPYFNEHMLIPLPFADYENIEQIKAWVNGIPALVEKMDYLMVPPSAQYYEHGTHKFLFYLDGSKNNLKVNFWDTTPNSITIWVNWKDQ